MDLILINRKPVFESRFKIHPMNFYKLKSGDMKKILLSMIVVASLAACKNKKSQLDKNNALMLQDTTARYNNSALTDKAKETQQTGNYTKTGSSKKTGTSNSSGSGSVSKSSDQVSTTTNKKKGWSHRAKGAAVGAGTGAVTGAIINKDNRAVGALIGVAVGAASGYIIGNEVDKKKEREKK